MKQGEQQPAGSQLILVGMTLLAFLLLAWLSVAQYEAYNLRSLDLGRMAQSMWGVRYGRPLVWTGDGIDWSYLANHVNIVFFLLAGIYAVWPSPVALLLVQALLFASGAIPVYRLACRRLDSRVALLPAAVYLLYPVAQTAVLFELHGDTLAAPLLLWAIEAADRQSWRHYAMWVALALSCKMYVAVAVAVFGLVLWSRGHRRAGWLTTVTAALWGAIAFFVVRAAFAPEGIEATATPATYLAYYFSSDVFATLPERLITAVIVFGPVLLLAWRAPLWLLPGAAVLVPALLSTGPGPSYDYRYHHYILGVPFLIAAAIYGAAAMRQREGEQGAWRRRLWLTFIVTLLFNAMLVDTPLNPRFFLSDPASGVGLTPSRYRRTGRDALKDEWLASIPEQAPVMADDTLGERLVNRPLFRRTDMMFSTLPEALPSVDYVIVDGLYDYVVAGGETILDGGVAFEHGTIATVLNGDDFVLERARDGLLQFSRSSTGLHQEVEVRAGSDGDVIATFDGLIGLRDVEIRPAGPRRFRLQFEWTALQPLDGRASLLAVSQPGALPHARILYLPTIGFYSTTAWELGQVIVERFEIELPPGTPAGRYPLTVGWYDSSSPYATFTDERSRLGEAITVGTLTVP